MQDQGVEMTDKEWRTQLKSAIRKFVESTDPFQEIIVWLDKLKGFEEEIELIKNYSNLSEQLQQMLTKICRDTLVTLDPNFLKYCQDFGFLYVQDDKGTESAVWEADYRSKVSSFYSRS